MVLVDDLDLDAGQHGSELGRSSGRADVGRLVGAIEIAEVGREPGQDFLPQGPRDRGTPREDGQLRGLLETARQ
ncbi:MAG TPA: hypothetical protein VKU84_19670, partial [Stellaceae bacterium]|nr:hypothetical protein [Stellaceae bacterium]